MPRRRTFSIIEEELILENYDKTVEELAVLLEKKGYRRSRKSINRKIEKMREEGLLGLRSEDTVQRAYKQRKNRKDEKSDGPSLRRGDGPSFPGSSWGDASWDDE